MNDAIYQLVADAVSRQTWYQKNANTIVATIGALVSILSLVLTMSLGLPQVATVLIAGAISALTALGIKLTRNGIQKSTATKLVSPHESAVLNAERVRAGYAGQPATAG